MLDPKELEKGKSQVEYFHSRISKKELVQFDYRALSGKLFSCIAPTLEGCVSDCNKALEQSGLNDRIKLN